MASSAVDVQKSQATLSSRGLELAMAAARAAAENNGLEILILDVRKLTSIFDYFVLVSGRSGRQLRAIADDIDRVLRIEMGDRRRNMEGYAESRWIVLDHGDVVVHLFTEEARAFYRLEDLWADGLRISP